MSAPDQNQLDAVCRGVLEIYRSEYDMASVKPSAYLANDLLVCVFQESDDRSPPGAEVAAMASRTAFQRANEQLFTNVVELETGRRVSTFMSANHVADGIFAELFFLAT
jgi:hypothetical protein